MPVECPGPKAGLGLQLESHRSYAPMGAGAFFLTLATRRVPPRLSAQAWHSIGVAGPLRLSGLLLPFDRSNTRGRAA